MIVLLLVGAGIVAWGIIHRTSDDDRGRYDKRLTDAGLVPGVGYDEAFEARKASTRSAGNVAAVIGVVGMVAALMGA